MRSTTSKRLLAVVLALASLFLLASPPAAHAQISLFGTASNPSDAGTKTGATDSTVTPPGSMSAGQLVLVAVQNRSGANSFGIKNVITGGQNWQKISHDNGGAPFETTNHSWAFFTCTFNGTWSADPSWTTSGTTTSLTVMMSVWSPSGAGKEWLMEARPAAKSYAAAATLTQNATTTRRNGALLVSFWGTTDDNTFGSLTGGWTTLGSAQYRNNSNMGLTAAYQIQGTAGSSGTPAITEATLGNDNGAGVIFAFREHTIDTTVPTVDVLVHAENSTNGTQITTTILGNGTSGTGGTWSFAGGTPSAYTVATAGEIRMYPTFVDRGGVYNDQSDTRGYRIDQTVSIPSSNAYLYTLSSAKNELVMDFLFQTNVPETGNHTYTWMGVTDGGGAGMCAFNLETNEATGYDTYVEDGDFNIWRLPQLAPSTTYGASIHGDFTNNVCEIVLYKLDVSGFTLLGVGNVSRLSAAPAQLDIMQTFQFGGEFALVQSASTYFDDLTLTWNTPRWPLIPLVGAGAGGGASGVSLLGVIGR